MKEELEKVFVFVGSVTIYTLIIYILYLAITTGNFWILLL